MVRKIFSKNEIFPSSPDNEYNALTHSMPNCIYKTKFFYLFLFSLCAFTPFSFAVGDLGGFRDIQIRSDEVVTVWLGYNSITNMNSLKNTAFYTIASSDDHDYSEGLQPISISRFAKASYSVGGWSEPELMDNLMHCTLPIPLKPGKKYTMTLSNGLIPSQFKQSMEFSLDFTPNPSFKLNQVGYSKRANIKLIYLSSYLGDGQPLDLSTYTTFKVCRSTDGSVVFQGSIEHVSDSDPQGCDKLFKLDISALNEEGEFYVWIDGLGRSYNFKNGNIVAREIYRIIAKGMYYQRCGTAIEQPYAEQWPRPMAHNQIYVTTKNIVHPWTEGIHDGVWGAIEYDPNSPSAGDWYVPEGPREIYGGHYDAGDYDLRITHVGVGERLMALYENFPERFYDGQVNIPEAGNGIPDILDEVAWSLKQWEYCQDYAGEIRGLDGGVAPGMESYRHPPMVKGTGDKDPLPYWMRKVTPYSSFAGAGLFAQAARVFRPFDSTRADKYLERAEAAYQYAYTHRDESWHSENEYIGQEEYSMDEYYNDYLLESACCWASGQLFSTTGKKLYWDHFVLNYPEFPWAVPFWNFDQWIVLWPMISTKQEEFTSGYINSLQHELLQEADNIVSWINSNGETGYQAACSNKGHSGQASPLHTVNLNPVYRAYLLTKEQKYLDAIATCVDFVLGMNPSECSWMTGAGTVYPMDPRNLNCKYDGVEEPYPGIVIYGPIEDYNGEKNIMYPDKSTMGFYRRMCDAFNWAEGTEYVVAEQQSNMYLAAGILLPDYINDSLGREGSSSNIIHFNNYPNPFNQETTIFISILKKSTLTIHIFNINGQKINTIGNRIVEAGHFTFIWDGTDFSGDVVPSGVYFCKVQAGQDSRIAKMLLLK